MNFYLCPHCGIGIEIIEVNCAIFRCGVYKETFQQIPPHLSKLECDAISDKIYGCGRPFRLINGELNPCEYI